MLLKEGVFLIYAPRKLKFSHAEFTKYDTEILLRYRAIHKAISVPNIKMKPNKVNKVFINKEETLDQNFKQITIRGHYN